MVIDSPASAEDVKYYYVKSFKWLNPMDHEMFDGNPKKGKVYRGWINTSTETYRIVYKNNTAMALQTISGSTEGYKADLVEISLDNVLDLDLKEKDLDLINTWMDFGNTDILVNNDTPILDIPTLISKAIEQNSSFEAELEAAHQELDNLADIDALLFFQISKIITFMLDDIHTIRTGPADHDWLNMDKDNGLGANIGSALQNIYSYTGEKNESAIIQAINSLFMELKRREYNNLNK